MSDIVERLRAVKTAECPDEIINAAEDGADEIEKLRAENAKLAASNHAYLSDYQEAAAEIEKLRAALREIKRRTQDAHPMSYVADYWRIAKEALGEKE